MLNPFCWHTRPDGRKECDACWARRQIYSKPQTVEIDVALLESLLIKASIMCQEEALDSDRKAHRRNAKSETTLREGRRADRYRKRAKIVLWLQSGLGNEVTFNWPLDY